MKKVLRKNILVTLRWQSWLDALPCQSKCREFKKIKNFIRIKKNHSPAPSLSNILEMQEVCISKVMIRDFCNIILRKYIF